VPPTAVQAMVTPPPAVKADPGPTASPSAAALTPIGPAIDVGTPPTPPASAKPSLASVATTAAPISLLPSAAKLDSSEAADASVSPPSASPGPGSGGLY
jgi:hypothetical protein